MKKILNVPTNNIKTHVKGTTWSGPKTNIFSAVWNLKQALSSGRKTRLIKVRNEECQYPIKVRNANLDFRTYKFYLGYPETYNNILNSNRSDFDKHLSLNYVSAFGTEEAINTYYETGYLSKNNFHGIGKSHLVKVVDIIDYLAKNKDDKAKIYFDQYLNPDTRDTKFFFDFFTKEHGNEWEIKYFNRKLWVVQLLDNEDVNYKMPTVIKILNAVISPVIYLIKFIPKKNVLQMPEYKCVTFRIGDVTNGYAVEFHIPKKFNFK